MRRSALAIALALAACTPEICARNSDCAAGLVCSSAGQCVPPPSDAGAGDGQDESSADAAIDAADPVIETGSSNGDDGR